MANISETHCAHHIMLSGEDSLCNKILRKKVSSLLQHSLLKRTSLATVNLLPLREMLFILMVTIIQSCFITSHNSFTNLLAVLFKGPQYIFTQLTIAFIWASVGEGPSECKFLIFSFI
jgi:hypothetical protein